MRCTLTFRKLLKSLLLGGLVLLAACTNLFQPEPLSDNYNPMDPDHYSPPQIVLPGLPETDAVADVRDLPFGFSGEWVDLTLYRWKSGINGDLSDWCDWRPGGQFKDTASVYQGILDTLFLDETYTGESFTIKIEAKYSYEPIATDSLTRTFTVNAVLTPTAVLRPQAIFSKTGEAFNFELCFDSMEDWTAADLQLKYDSTQIEITNIDTISNGASLSFFTIQAGSVDLSLGNYGDAAPIVLSLRGTALENAGVYSISMSGTRVMNGPTVNDTLTVTPSQSRVIVLP